MEGRCQADIARTLGKSKSTISGHVKVLENEGFIKRIKGTGRVKLIDDGIERGSKANTLDYYLDKTNDGRGVTPISKKRAAVRTALAHHLKYELPIFKSGDYQWATKETRIYHNTQTLSGRIDISAGPVTVAIFRTYQDVMTAWGKREKQIKSECLYLYPPELELTAEEVPQFEEFGRKLCNEAAAVMESKMGWSLGVPIIQTNWKPHFAIELPYAQGRSDKFTLYSPDGKAWLSNSNGACEFEFSEPNYALTLLDAGRAVEELETRQNLTQYQLEELVDSHTELTQKVEEIKEEVSIARDERDNIRRELMEEQKLNKDILEAFTQNNRTLAELHKSISQITRDQMQHQMPPEEHFHSSYDDTGGMFQ